MSFAYKVDGTVSRPYLSMNTSTTTNALTIGNANGAYHRLGTRALMLPSSVLCVDPLSKQGSTRFQDTPRGGGGAPSPYAGNLAGNASGNACGTRSRLWNEGVDASVLRPPCHPLTERAARFHDLLHRGNHPHSMPGPRVGAAGMQAGNAHVHQAV